MTLPHFACLLMLAPAWAPPVAPQEAPFEVRAARPVRSRIDQLVAARLKELGLQPAHGCSDEVFLRRAFLDVIGTLPTLEEAEAFLKDRDPDKRAALIERLLTRPEFADYWAMRWGDLLRIKAEFPINLWPNAVQAYDRWVRASLRDNLPMDRFARELLTSSGSCFRVPPANFWRATQSREPEALASAVALTFMGMRTDHWPPERLAGLAALFAQVGYKATGEWKEEIVFFDASRPLPQAPRFPDGKPCKLVPGQDPRQVFADWLLAKGNPVYARSLANRVWSWLMGRGIVHETDDLRPDNPPDNPALLAWLEQELVSARWDLKHVFRLILNSATWQRSSIPRKAHPQAAAAFAHYAIRPLEAEVLIDALCQITGTTEKYSSPIPEPFTFIPEDLRAIALADGSTTSPFLELFGRSPRDTGLESERESRPTSAQRLHLLNSTHVQRKIETSAKLRALLAAGGGLPKLVTSVYLTVLSRPPTDAELAAVRAYFESRTVSPREAAVDLVWALVNSTEFLHRH